MDKNDLQNIMISMNMTIKQAMEKLSETAKQILFAVDRHNVLLGTVTDGDIRRGLLKGLRFNDSMDKVMFRDFLFLRYNTSDLKTQAKEIMIEKNIRIIPVIEESGEISDAITWTDLFDSVEKKQYNKKTNQVVIMAGGQGKRLDPFTKVLPKPLIPIGNKPIIELIMERFYQYGFHKFIYTLNYKKEYIKLYLKENRLLYDIDWIEEESFLGTAGSLSLLEGRITDTFFVTNCDSLLDLNFENLLKWHKDNSATITIVGCHDEVKIPFGVLELSNGKLERIIEKPVHDIMINTGVYVVEPHVITFIPKGKRIDMNELIELVSEKETVSVFPIYKGWRDLGQWEAFNKNATKIECPI